MQTGAPVSEAGVLLHEHELRVGNYASAFMITGLVVRLAQGLQINIELPSESTGVVSGRASVATRESRRRLMWSVSIMDVWVGSGVDELTMLDEANIKVQLLVVSRTSYSRQMAQSSISSPTLGLSHHETSILLT